jgi:hypothetical protein
VCPAGAGRDSWPLTQRGRPVSLGPALSQPRQRPLGKISTLFLPKTAPMQFGDRFGQIATRRVPTGRTLIGYGVTSPATPRGSPRVALRSTGADPQPAPRRVISA